MVYCTKCNKSLRRHLITGKLCPECKTAFKHKCGKCMKIYSSVEILKKHLKTCGRSESFKLSLLHLSCDSCSYKTDRKSRLSNHILAKHLPRDPNLNKCKKCGRSYSWRSDLLKHLKICNKSKDIKKSLQRYSCDLCAFKSDRKYRLADHIQVKHLPKILSSQKCQKCNKSCSRRSTLQNHLKICGKSKNLKHSMLRYSCDHCAYKSDKKQRIADHIYAKHLKRASSLNKCSKCDKSFSERSNFLRHSKRCGKSKDFMNSLLRYLCGHCEFKGYTKQNLANHIQTKHLPRNLNLNNCNKCHKNFSDRSGLKRHLKICGKSKNFKNL